MKSKKKKWTNKQGKLNSPVSHILLIEDNPDDIRLIQWIISGIRKSQFKLECVDRLNKALKRLAKGGIDVILLDLGLSDSQGIDTLRSVYNKAPKVPIVVLTCLGDEKLGVQAIKEGAQDYLIKGQVDSKLLKRTIMYAIERKQAEKFLKESREKIKNILESSPDAISVTDLNGNITECNKQTLKMHGFSSKEEVIGKSAFMFIAEKYRKRAMDNLKKTLKCGTVKNMEYNLLTKDGKEFQGELSASVIKDTSDKPVAFVAVTKDITERKQAEEKLHYQADLLKNVSDAIISTDLDFNIRSWNRAAETMYGWSAHEVMEKSLLEVTKLEFPYDKEPAVLKKLFKKRHWNGEIIQKHMNNTVINVLASFSLLKDDSENPVGIVAVIRDITERKQIEEKYTEQLKSLIKLGNQMRMELNLEALLQDICNTIVETQGWRQVILSLRDYNAGTAQTVAMAGYDEKTKKKTMSKPPVLIKTAEKFLREEFKISRSYYIDHLHWKEMQRYSADLVITSVKDLKPEGWHEKDILLIPIQGKENILGFISPDNPVDGKRPPKESIQALEIFADQTAVAIENARLYEQAQHEIAERKSTEEELRETRDYLENMINSANAAIIVWNPQFRIIRFNYASEHLTGYTAHEVMGRELKILFPKASQDQLLSEFKRTLDGEYWNSVEIPILCKNGNIRIVFWNSANIYAEDCATVIATTAQGIDITDRKRAEEQIKQSLKEKEVLLKEIHHRVKNNMQIISSLLNLQSRYIKGKKTLEMFQNSQARIRAMALVHEKLYRSQDLARIDFAEYVQDLVKQLFRSHGISPTKIKFNIRIKDVFLDINRAIPCSLIINELVSNSLKHAFPASAKATAGKPASVKTMAGKPHGRKGKIDIDFYLGKDNKLLLKIKDNGVGLPDKIDFKNTKTLGLQLVTTLVEQLNGTIEVDTKGGTMFKIKFDKPESK